MAKRQYRMTKSFGNKLYSIELGESVVKKDLPSLGKSAHDLIKKAIEERLMVDPIKYGKPLRYSLTGSRRLRVGKYRIIYHINIQLRKVIITAIHHRKDSYD